MTKEILSKKEILTVEGKVWQPYLNSKKYLQAVLADIIVEICESETRVFWRKVFKFFSFAFIIESHVSNTGPQIEVKKGLRIILWDKVKINSQESNIQKQKGWLQARGLFAASCPQQSYLNLQDQNTGVNYFKKWDEAARRQRKKFLQLIQDKKYFIQKVETEKYLTEYQNASLSKTLKKFFTQKTRNFQNIYQADLENVLVFDERGNCLGGLSYVCDKETFQSIHLTAFVTSLGEKTPVSVGLIDFWVGDCLSKKIPFATLGIVWSPGQPKSWRGYSNFKLHFKPQIATYKNVYIKFTFKI